MGHYLDLARSVLPVADVPVCEPLHTADVPEAPARATAHHGEEQPEQPADPEGLAEAIAGLVTMLRDRGATIREVVLVAPADPSLPEPTRPVGEILPPPSWLSSAQRRLWRERTAFYRSTGLSQDDAEQEAMAELVMTGRLCDPAKRFPWP